MIWYKDTKLKTKKGQKQVSDPTSTYEKHTPERVSSNVTKIVKKRKFKHSFFLYSVNVTQQNSKCGLKCTSEGLK